VRLAWPQALDDPDPEVRLRRTRLALETIISRIRPALFFYPALLCGYLALAHASANVTATVVAIGLQLGLSIGRSVVYRRSTAARDANPERWRTIVALLAAAVMIVWDSFLLFEVWQRELDAPAMLLVTASLVLRASGTFAVSPDLRMYRMWSRWSSVPMLVAPIVLPTLDGLILMCAFLSHLVYSEVQSRNLNTEFWRGVIATDSLETAHAKLRLEVAMRERAEVELRLAQKLESVGRLAAGIAHEINTPLQVIVASHGFLEHGITDLLRISATYKAALSPEARAALDPDLEVDLAYLAEELPESVRLAREQLDRTAGIVRSVKTFADFEGDGKVSLNINEALITTLTIARHECGEVADVVTDLGEVPRVDACVGELNQTFLHLIVNAAQAMAPVHTATGKRGTLGVTTRCEAGHVWIVISDTGVGVPDSIKDRIFDPFFTTKPVGQGTGQGLAMARTVVARHGGALTFESEVGRGTTFTIRLPIAGTAARAAA
jgi:signal transduction histidine kinase